MTKLLLGSSLLGTILSICGCVPEPKGEPLIVEVAGSTNDCKVSVNKEEVTSQRLLQIASSGAYSWAIIRADRVSPYRCLGAAIITLQQAGITTIKTQGLRSSS